MSEPSPSIDELRTQYERLNEQRIQAQTKLDAAEESLRELSADAVEQFGTSDVAELSQKLEQMESENKKRLTEYQTLLETISDDLANIEEGPTETPEDAVDDES